MTKQWTVATCMAVAVAAAVCLSSTSSTVHAQGNSGAAQACQNGGWRMITTATGQPFKNQGACVKYAAQGGTLVPNAFAAACHSFLSILETQGSSLLCYVLPDAPDQVDYLMKICNENGGSTDGSSFIDGLAMCTF